MRAIARDLSPIPVPALDWLPNDLRDRGLRFLQASTWRVRRTPVLLRPALSLDERDIACPHVRFAHLSRAAVQTERDLSTVVAYAFAGVTRGGAAAMTPAIRSRRRREAGDCVAKSTSCMRFCAVVPRSS